MLAGVEPVTTAGNAKAIACRIRRPPIRLSLADYILKLELLPMEELQKIAKSGHSLQALIEKINQYIKPGV